MRAMGRRFHALALPSLAAAAVLAAWSVARANQVSSSGTINQYNWRLPYGVSSLNGLWTTGSVEFTDPGEVDSQGNAQHTARALFVHRNTLRQRISRILTDWNLDLDDPYTILNLMVAIKAWRLHRGSPQPMRPE